MTRVMDAAHGVGIAHLPQWPEPQWAHTVIAWSAHRGQPYPIPVEDAPYDPGPSWCGHPLAFFSVPWPDDDPAPTCAKCIRRRDADEGGGCRVPDGKRPGTLGRAPGRLRGTTDVAASVGPAGIVPADLPTDSREGGRV